MTETSSTTRKVAKSAGRVRVNKGFLSGFEARAIEWLIPRLPQWVLPDHLTMLGIIAAVVMAIAYVLTTYSLHWIWLVNVGLVVHWFADSLDGSLARARKLERKKHGFFVDHFSDAVSVLFLVVGMGLSPLMRLDIAFMVISAYYAHMILTYLKALVTNYFQISIGVIGPTEARFLLIVLNSVLWYFHNPQFSWMGQSWTLLDSIGLAGSVLAFLAFLIGGEKQRRELAKIDPLPRRPKSS